MGLRCSLLGHAYADPEIDRDRDDRGDEVVVTVRETRICERCGAETVVSENTEVRPVEPEPSADPEPDAGADESPDAGESPGVDDEFEQPSSAAEDDGVILDATEEGSEAEPEREPGEWPEADDTRVEAGPATADAEEGVDDGAEAAGSEDDGEGSPEADDAETTTEGGEIIDADGERGVDVADASPAGDWPDPGPDAEDEGFDADTAAADGEVEMGGLTPQGVADAEADGEAVVGGEAFDSGIESGGSAETSPDDPVDVDAEFVCPACDYVEPVLNSSLRAGDICPECQRGYLSEESPTRN